MEDFLVLPTTDTPSVKPKTENFLVLPTPTNTERFPTTPEAKKALTLEGELGLSTYKSPVKPAKIDSQDQSYNDTVRRYYESGQTLLTLPLIPGQSLDTNVSPGSYDKDGKLLSPSISGAAVPEPPGGYDRQGRPLDENGKPYKVPSLSSDIHKGMVDIVKRSATNVLAFADATGTKFNNLSSDLKNAIDNTLGKSVYWNEASKTVADMFGVPITMAPSWALTSASKIIAKAITGDQEFADYIAESVGKQTTWEPRSVIGKFILSHAEPIFKMASEMVHRSIAHPIGNLPAINPDPSKPLWSKTVNDYFPVEDIMQFVGEAMLFKKAHEIGVGTKSLLEQAGKNLKSGIEAKNLEDSLRYTPSVIPPETPSTGADFSPFFVPPTTTGPVTTSGKVKTNVASDNFLTIPDNKPVEDQSNIPTVEKKEPLQDMVERTQAKVEEIAKIQADLEEAKKAIAETPVEDVIKEELKLKNEQVQELLKNKPEQVSEIPEEESLAKSIEDSLGTVDEVSEVPIVEKYKVNEGKAITIYRGRAKEDQGKVQGDAQFYTTSRKRAQEFADTNKDAGLTPEVIKRTITLNKIARKADILQAGKEEGKYKEGDTSIEEEPIDLLDEPEVVNNLIKKGFDAASTPEYRVGKENQSKIKNEFVALFRNPYKDQPVAPKESKVAKVKAKPITELDRQTGTPLPKKLADPQEHPFRDKKVGYTNSISKLYKEKINDVRSNPEVFTRYLINEMNRYLNGEDVNVKQIRDGLSGIAAQAEELKGFFDRTEDFLRWKGTAGEAARWARNADRSGQKRTGGTQLNMMIPIDKLPDMVKQVLKDIRVSFDGSIYRNKELFDKTGFWLGKDGKWRYEIDDSNIKIAKSTLDHIKTGFSEGNLPAFIWNKEANNLFNAIPDLRKVKVIIGEQLVGKSGYYDSATKAIHIGKKDIQNTFIHELQHAVNDIVGSKFKGSNPLHEERIIIRQILDEAQHTVKEPALREEIRRLIEGMDNGSIGTNEVRGILRSRRETIPLEQSDYEAIDLPSKGVVAGGIENYMKNPGEMEARLASRRMDMSVEQRKAEPPWKTLEDMIHEEGLDFPAIWPNQDFKYQSRTGMTLYTGLDPSEAAKQILKGAKEFSDYIKEARGMKSFKPAEAVDRLRREFNRSYIDRSGNIRKDLLESLGNEGYRIIQKMYLSKGASSLAAQQLKQMGKEVYDGLTSNQKRILDSVILADRMIDISKYKNDFKFPKKISTDGKIPDLSIKYRMSFKEFEGLSDRQAIDIENRAKAYFDWMKKPLKDLLDAELISQKEYDALVSHNYRKIKLVEIFDNEQIPALKPTDRTVYDSGVEALKRGKDTDIYEPSSEVMALEVFNRSYGRILNNAANRTLLDLARSDKENPFVRTKDSPSDMIPSGWHRIYVYEGGERKSLYISPDMAKEWITKSPEMTYKMSQFLRVFSGSPILRTFATGINWGFALANLPRDIMHSWFAARIFKDGKWTPIYSSQSPVATYQFGRNYGRVFLDTIFRRGRYEDYIREGGGMEFLVHQGRLLQRGRHIGGEFDKFLDVMGYPGETSEILTRLNIREQVIINRAAEKGISFEEAYKDKNITQEATFAARDYMDFGQGGGIVKGLDNMFPYVSAGIQGMRGFWRALTQNPIATLWKLSQFAAIVTGLYIYNQKQNPETMKSLKGNLNMQNNLVIPMGDEFSYLDERGQRRYPFYKIPLDNNMRFFKVFFEAAVDKWLGNPVDINAVTLALGQLSPINISVLPPTVAGVLGYASNKDFWLNEDIWRGTDKAIGYQLPKWITKKERGGSEEEYDAYPGQTPQAMKDLGALTGTSPERDKYLIEQLVTSGSEFAWLSGYGYDKIFGGMSKDQREQMLAETLSKLPIAKRFIGVTHPATQYSASIDQAAEDSSVKRLVENRGLDTLVDGYLYKSDASGKSLVKVDEIYRYIRSFKDPDTQDRLFKDFEFQKATKDLPNMAFWRGLRRIIDTDRRAEEYVKRWKASNDAERAELRKELGVVSIAGGIASDDFLEAVARIKNQ